MDTTRQQKINRLLQKELSEVFLLQTRSAQGLLISVSQVRVSPDLSTARVYLSIFPSENGPAVLASVQQQSKSIKHDLAGRLRFQLRRMPELTFFIDDSLDYAENIDNLLNKINPR